LYLSYAWSAFIGGTRQWSRWEKPMNRNLKFAARILAILCVFLGVIWILQGINVLPGSFMTGQIQWAYRGGIIAIIGLVLLFVLRRRRS
jgi:hypothetical protein